MKTLHTLLRLNLLCFQNGYFHNINFVNDDPYERVEVINRHIKTADRILFIDYSIFIDPESLAKVFTDFKNSHCLVFPCVKDGINWDTFRAKACSGTTEPTEQWGLEFDTELGQKIGESMYWVRKTDPKSWVMETKHVNKILKGRKEPIKLPAKNNELFDKLIASGVKICAWTAARLVVTYPHECLSNILESAGVKTT